MGLKKDHKWLAVGTLVLTLGVSSGSANAQYVSKDALNANPFLVGAGGQITAAAGGLSYEPVGPAALGLALPGATLTLKPGETANVAGVPFFVGGEQLVIGTKLPAQRIFSKAIEAVEAPQVLEQEN